MWRGINWCGLLGVENWCGKFHKTVLSGGRAADPSNLALALLQDTVYIQTHLIQSFTNCIFFQQKILIGKQICWKILCYVKRFLCWKIFSEISLLQKIARTQG